MNKAKRYNKGKKRYNLIPAKALSDLAEVYTRGAHKYTVYKDEDGKIILGKDISLEQSSGLEVIDDGADNWRKGLSWMGAMDSIERHIQAWRAGEDFDPELNTYHLANAAWGLFSILEYYKIYPQGDDRPHSYLNTPKIGLDIDEVLADWVNPWCELWGFKTPESWYFDRHIIQKFKDMEEKGYLDDFYMKLKPLTLPSEIPFEPHCYVTSRPVKQEITEAWLDKHGYPVRPVITVPVGTSKVDVLKEAGVDVFIDDRFENFVELNKAGIFTYLFDAPHNQRYSVGYKRIKSLQELILI